MAVHIDDQQTFQNGIQTDPPEVVLSFEATYKEYQAILGSYLLHSTDSQEVAEDVVQETFIKAWQVWSTVREPQHVKAWLYRIAKNRNIDNYRKRTRYGHITVRSLQDIQEDLRDESASCNQEEHYLTQELVHLTLARMKPQARQILLMALHEGKSYQEIGEILGLSLPAVRSRVHRARQSFRTLFRELDQSDPLKGDRETRHHAPTHEKRERERARCSSHLLKEK